jgi:hypothetical protein
VPEPKINITEDLQEIDYNEALTAGGCKKSDHVNLTIGAGRFEFRTCPRCKLEIYKP